MTNTGERTLITNMPQANIFRWREGAGWLILSGGGSFEEGKHEAIDALMLSRNIADGALAYIWSAGDIETAGQHLQYYDDLGGPSSYLVDVISEDDDTLREALHDAGIIVIGDGPDIGRLYNSLHGAAIEALSAAFERGSLIVGIGAGAEVFGDWVLRPASEGVRQGFGWLSGAAIVPVALSNAERRTLRGLLRSQPFAYGLGLGVGSALAFGPGTIESWGSNEVAVTLGQGYLDDDDAESF